MPQEPLQDPTTDDRVELAASPADDELPTPINHDLLYSDIQNYLPEVDFFIELLKGQSQNRVIYNMLTRDASLAKLPGANFYLAQYYMHAYCLSLHEKVKATLEDGENKTAALDRISQFAESLSIGKDIFSILPEALVEENFRAQSGINSDSPLESEDKERLRAHLIALHDYYMRCAKDQLQVLCLRYLDGQLLALGCEGYGKHLPGMLALLLRFAKGDETVVDLPIWHQFGEVDVKKLYNVGLLDEPLVVLIRELKKYGDIQKIIDGNRKGLLSKEQIEQVFGVKVSDLSEQDDEPVLQQTAFLVEDEDTDEGEEAVDVDFDDVHVYEEVIPQSLYQPGPGDEAALGAKSAAPAGANAAEQQQAEQKAFTRTRRSMQQSMRLYQSSLGGNNSNAVEKLTPAQRLQRHQQKHLEKMSAAMSQGAESATAKDALRGDSGEKIYADAATRDQAAARLDQLQMRGQRPFGTGGIRADGNGIARQPTVRGSRGKKGFRARFKAGARRLAERTGLMQPPLPKPEIKVVLPGAQPVSRGDFAGHLARDEVKNPTHVGTGVAALNTTSVTKAPLVPPRQPLQPLGDAPPPPPPMPSGDQLGNNGAILPSAATLDPTFQPPYDRLQRDTQPGVATAMTGSSTAAPRPAPRRQSTSTAGGMGSLAAAVAAAASTSGSDVPPPPPPRRPSASQSTGPDSSGLTGGAELSATSKKASPPPIAAKPTSPPKPAVAAKPSTTPKLPAASDQSGSASPQVRARTATEPENALSQVRSSIVRGRGRGRGAPAGRGRGGSSEFFQSSSAPAGRGAAPRGRTPGAPAPGRGGSSSNC